MMAVDNTVAVLDYHNHYHRAGHFSHEGQVKKCGSNPDMARAAEVAMKAEAKKKKKQRVKKSVRFAETVKQHDGLTPHKRVFDEVVHDLFNRPDDRYKTIRDVLNAGNILILERLNEQLLELMKRCSQGKTPVLNCGGGRNNVVDERFAPWLFKLSERVVSNVDILKEHEENNLALPEGLGDSFRI